MSAIGQKTRLRFLLSTPLMYGASESGVEFDAKLPRYIRITDIRPDGTLDPDKAVSLPRDTALPYLLTDRDILLARSGATVGKAFLYRSDGDEACFAGYLIRARCDQRRMLAEYLAYYLQSAGYWDFINSSALQATIQNVSVELYKEILVTHPSVEQQKKVVAYLDEQTRKIDQLMDMRRRQMALLKEQRAALIQEAVTRGLNPNAPMKDSGLPWLGEIPAHWEVRKLKGLTSILTCGYASTPEYVNEDVGSPFLSAQNVQNNHLLLEKYNFISKHLHQQLTRVRRPVLGDVLVTRVGAGIGDACIVDIDLEFSVYVSLTHIRTSTELLNTILVYFFQTQYSKLLNGDGTVVGGGVGNLNVRNLARYPFPLPPMHEQRLIVEFLDSEGVKTNRLISAYKRQLELLSEYRAALIHECVTGQRSVPETSKA